MEADVELVLDSASRHGDNHDCWGSISYLRIPRKVMLPHFLSIFFKHLLKTKFLMLPVYQSTGGHEWHRHGGAETSMDLMNKARSPFPFYSSNLLCRHNASECFHQALYQLVRRQRFCFPFITRNKPPYDRLAVDMWGNNPFENLCL